MSTKISAVFPLGFQDKTYLAWERNYKWRAHERWESLLDRSTFRKLLRAGEYVEAAARAVRIESRTSLLFSFEKMALRDAVKSPEGARLFARGLYDFYMEGDNWRRSLSGGARLLGSYRGGRRGF